MEGVNKQINILTAGKWNTYLQEMCEYHRKDQKKPDIIQ